MSRKCFLSQEIGGATELKSLPTPINLFEDECVFCHSFRTSQFHGPMVRCLEGRVVSIDEGNSSNAIYLHKKCLEWASGLWFKDDIVMNFESEIRRASKLRCTRCGLKGAALGCYYDPCLKSFHVPCALQTIGCLWDVDNCCVLCPEHSSKALPCYKLDTHTKKYNNSSSLGQSYPHNEEIFKACQPEEVKSDHPEAASSCPSDQLVLLGLSLSVEEKDFVQKFACWTNTTLTKEWANNVTHVILGKGASSSWSRSFEVLMGILLGKWVLHFEWIADCLQLAPGPEASYEVAFSTDSQGTMDGPKQGRIRASEGGPKLFSGLCFCLSDYMNPDNKDRMRGLIAAAEGRVLEKRDLLLPPKPPGNSSSSVKKPKLPYYFVYDVDAPREFSSSALREEMEEAREQASASSGTQVICHLRVLDAIAAYDANILNV